MGAIPQQAPQGFGGGFPNQGFGGGQQPQGFGQQQPGGGPLGAQQPQTGLEGPQFQQLINNLDTAGADSKFNTQLAKMTEQFSNTFEQGLGSAIQANAKGGGGGGGGGG